MHRRWNEWWWFSSSGVADLVFNFLANLSIVLISDEKIINHNDSDSIPRVFQVCSISANPPATSTA